MSNLSTVTDNMLPVSSETFVDNLAAGISAGADTVPMLSLSEYSDGDSVVLTVDPGTADQATFIGKVDGNEVIDVEWTEGNVGASHAAGATVIDYDSATHYNVVTKLLRMFANQDGTLKTAAIQQALNISTAAPTDWTPLANTPIVTDVKSASLIDLSFPLADYTDRLSKGMKLRIPRLGTTPDKSLKLNGTNQSAVKSSPTGYTFTDDYTIEAWVWAENYSNSMQTIVGRHSGSTGFEMRFDGVSNGIAMVNSTSASVYRVIRSTTPLPLGRWVHVAGVVDISAGAYKIYYDGIEQSTTMATAGSMTGFVQGGNIMIGDRTDGSSLFKGKISEVRIWNTLRSATEILDNMNQPLTGTESGLLGYWKLNGDFLDSASAGNNLTGNGGAVATNTENPFNALAFATIVTNPTLVSGDTNMTVRTPNGYPIPNTTVGGSQFSALAAPYGSPDKMSVAPISYIDENGWSVYDNGSAKTYIKDVIVTSIASTGTLALTPDVITVNAPVGVNLNNDVYISISDTLQPFIAVLAASSINATSMDLRTRNLAGSTQSLSSTAKITITLVSKP